MYEFIEKMQNPVIAYLFNIDKLHNIIELKINQLNFFLTIIMVNNKNNIGFLHIFTEIS